MSIYQCIQCGETRESDKPCTCLSCGFKMFPIPYDKKTILIQEIETFEEKLTHPVISEEDIQYVNKEKDDKRIPNVIFLQNNTYNCSHFEEMIVQFKKNVNRVEKYLKEPFSKSYKVNFKKAEAKLCIRDEVIQNTLAVFNQTFELTPVTFPKVLMQYEETEKTEYSDLIDEALSCCYKMIDKINTYVQLNQVYGADYQCTYYKMSSDKDQSPEKLLQKSIEKMHQILATQYIVDLLDDGIDELFEMVDSIWQTINVLLQLPLKNIVMTYFEGEENKGNHISYLDTFLANHYAEVKALFDETNLVSETEEKLFKLYVEILNLDTLHLLTNQKIIIRKAGEQKLHELIGLDQIKSMVDRIKVYAIQNKDAQLNMHMAFYGNPGSGKTEVARLIAEILYENHVLPTKKVIETDRSGLVSGYLGQTATKTLEIIHSAMGGVLFIDEAYALNENNDSYGQEAISTLIKAMEDYRGKFVVILAGYENKLKKMIETNPGFQSRLQFHLHFPNYNRSELQQIAQLMLKKNKYQITDDAMSKMLDITDSLRKNENFANAREIRNILDQVIMFQNMRAQDENDRLLGAVDVTRYINENHLPLTTSQEGVKTKILSADEELEQLIGLERVKKTIRKIKAFAKRNANDASLNLHMCFYGNPGTGKTEVARILSRILYEAGVLSEAKVVETDSSGLIAGFVGQTATKTHEKVQDAMGGILFIDEAYTLAQQTNNGMIVNYGDEAIAALLKDMEDYRGKFCVILAGYQKEMQDMINRNPGLASRIQFSLEFPDYTDDELRQIARLFLRKKQYSIEEDALDEIIKIVSIERKQPNFANARTIRNILDQVIMNQNLRCEDTEDYTIILEDVEEYIFDNNIQVDSYTASDLS